MEADSIVHLYMGQCGIGLANTYWSNVSSVGIAGSGGLPCVVVDGETKPAANLRRCLCGLLRDDNIVLGKASHTSWSSGYNSPLVEGVVERVRRITEEIGSLDGFILTHSYGGGTGSGVTSQLLKLLHDQYPKQSIVCVSVTPFAAGDGPLVHYNTLLTLEQQQLFSDLVLLMHNEWYYSNIKERSDGVTMEDINGLMSSCLVNCTQPLFDTKMHRHQVLPSKLVTTLADGQHKLVSTAHTAFDALSWQQGLGKIMPKSLPPSTRALSVLQVSRGNMYDIKYLMSSVGDTNKRLQQLYRPTTCRPNPIEHWYSREPSGNKLLSLLINSNVVNSMLCTLNRKSQIMFQTKAYTHWYLKHGFEHDQFDSAFDSLTTVIECYKSL